MAGASVKKATEALVNAAQQAADKQTQEDAANIASGGGPQVRLLYTPSLITRLHTLT